MSGIAVQPAAPPAEQLPATSRRGLGGRTTYVACMLASTVVSFGRMFVLAALLDARGFGRYNLGLLIFSVASYVASVGLTEGLGREVPLLRGAGETARAVRARDAAVLGSAATSAAVGLVIALALAVVARWQADVAPLPWIGLLLFATIPFNLLLIDLVGRHLSTDYAVVLLLKNAGALALAAAGARWLGVPGAIVGEAVATLVASALCIARYCPELPASLRDAGALRREAVRIARIGIPFVLASVVLTLTLGMDRWLVQLRHGAEQLGLYSFAFLGWTAGMVISNMVGVYVNPRIVSHWARTRDVGATSRVVWRLALGIAALFLAAMAPVLWLARLVIEARYPQYRAAVPLLAPVYLATMCWAMNFTGALFVVRGEGGIPLRLSIVNGVLTAALLGGVALLHPPLVGYAWAFLGGRVLYLATSGWLAQRTLRRWALETVGATA